jgi:hypothetical protein
MDMKRRLPSLGGLSNRRRSNSWRRIVAWALFWIVAVQGVAVLYLECFHSDFLDPKYGCRVVALREQRRQQSDRPLLLALGSSRTEQGFRPSLLESTGPMFYNLGRGGSSPLLYLLTLRRLLSDGVRPDGLLVEIFPPALVEGEESAVVYKPTLRDWPLLRRYPIHARTWTFWLQDRLLLWYKYRSGFLASLAPGLLPAQARWGENLWDYRGGEWRAVGDWISPVERRRLTDDARRRYAQSLNHFHIAADADRALRELLEMCRAQGIAVVLFLMPESDEFRAWYPPEARRRLSAYLAALQNEYGLASIDARDWFDKSEFSDGHHLLKRSAVTFTHRFAREVVSLMEP